MRVKKFVYYLIFFGSVLFSVFLLKTDFVISLLQSFKGSEMIGSFFSGILFSSILTVTPATVALGEIANSYSIFWTAFFGGLGALAGDYLIFKFVRDSLSESFSVAFRSFGNRKIFSIFKNRRFGFFSSLVGAIIIASPLPDEIGLTMMGLNNMKTHIFIPLSFSLNFIGIIIIGLVSRNI